MNTGRTRPSGRSSDSLGGVAVVQSSLDYRDKPSRCCAGQVLADWSTVFLENGQHTRPGFDAVPRGLSKPTPCVGRQAAVCAGQPAVLFSFFTVVTRPQ